MDVLEKVLPKLIEEKPSFVWMQDNASIHQSKETLGFFELHEIPRLRWPARSPDLKPIENLWGIITRKLDAVVGTKGEATTADELWKKVQNCFEQPKPKPSLDEYELFKARLDEETDLI